jgi:hypothetical protein
MSLLFRKIPRPAPAERLFEPPGWVWTRSGDVGWWVRADWLDALIGPDGLRLDEWRRDGRLTTVKTGPHRVVYRVELPEGAVFVKHFLVPDLRAKFRQWVRRGKGRNEGTRTRFLSAIGVPTITPVALGEQRRRAFLLENYLITHAITGAVPLDEFVERRLPRWPAARQARIRQSLAESLALLTARLHEAGFVHQDFHPGNIMVRMDDGDDEPSLAMIDLDALRVCRPLSWHDAQINLALLNHYFWLRCGRADRYRFLRTYLQARRVLHPDPASLARGIEGATRAWAERLWRRWGRRCQGTNKYFASYSGPRTWAVASRDLDPATVRALLADPDAPFFREGAVTLKDSRTATVAEVTMEVGGRPARVIYKRFNKKKWIDPLLTYFRPSRAWQAWQAGQHLASRAIPTPRNLAFIARMRPRLRDLFWYLPHETYLVTLKEEPSITLDRYLRTVLPALDPAARRGRIAALTRALARLLRMLHERSLSDRDLKAANLLLLGDPDADDVRLSVIDLAGVRLIHPLPKHRRIQNLARLSLSLAEVPGRTRTDSLRFLRAYLPWGLSPHNDWKGLWRAIASASQAKRERNQRQGRELS